MPSRFRPPLSRAAQIQQARRVIAFTGAGISTACGIPDFRGPSGEPCMQGPAADRADTRTVTQTGAGRAAGPVPFRCPLLGYPGLLMPVPNALCTLARRPPPACCQGLCGEVECEE